MTHLRDTALACFQQGIKAADPYLAVKHHLRVVDGKLSLLQANGCYRVGNWSTVQVLAFGKAACAMAKAAKDSIPTHYLVKPCLAITNDENAVVLEGIEVLTASHPLPDIRGLQAAKVVADRVNAAQAGDLVLVLISGGGSALLPLPVASISLAEKTMTTDLLLASGATINQINCVRKHLSQLKGGGLAQLAKPADLHALILSDVLGDDVSSIASGPTVPDNTTYAEATAILQSKRLWHKVPANVRQHLENGQAGFIAETVKPDDPTFLTASYSFIGSNRQSIQAMQQAAQNQGYKTLVYSDQLCGEAREQAEQLVHFARIQRQSTDQQPLAIVAGGETTVTLKGNGRGGRNQEMALAFAIAAEQQGLSGEWLFLSGGTDGRDGPTDAAGGMVDSGTLHRLLASGINPQTLLDDNDSYTALTLSNDLLRTGATGTNVADLQLLLLKP